MSDVLSFVIEEEFAGQRLDKALASIQSDYSRARIQSLLEDGAVQLNGSVFSKASYKVTAGDEIILSVPEAVAAEPEPEDIPLDIVYEDEDLLVINKQVGLVVHPGAGNHTGTLVNALLYHCGDELSGIGGVMRPGIVHRLDKDTSGLIVVAKNDKAHKGLAAQLEDRSLSRIYKALVLGVPVPLKGKIDMPIGRDPRNRLKMAVNVRGGKEARTFFKVERDFGGIFSLVECKLESGRTHQIRVHMAAHKNPLIGDPLYGPQKTAVQAALRKLEIEDAAQEAFLSFPRQVLHAQSISFVHPITKKHMEFDNSLPCDISKLLKIIE